jgi:hypothetical protein
MSKLGLSVLLAIVVTAALASTAPAAIKFAKIHYDAAVADRCSYNAPAKSEKTC